MCHSNILIKVIKLDKDKLMQRMVLLEQEIQKAQNAVVNATAQLHMLMGGKEELSHLLRELESSVKESFEIC